MCIFVAIATTSNVVKADSFCRRLRQCISTVGKEIFNSNAIRSRRCPEAAKRNTDFSRYVSFGTATGMASPTD